MRSEDMLAIQQQIARYSYTFDSGDADGWAKVFTTDGLWEFYATGATKPTTRLEGYAALQNFCAQRFSERRGGVTSYHHQSGIMFDELTANSAVVRAMLIITIQVPGEQAQMYMTGVYHDKWVKTDSMSWTPHKPGLTSAPAYAIMRALSCPARPPASREPIKTQGVRHEMSQLLEGKPAHQPVLRILRSPSLWRNASSGKPRT